MGSWHAPKPVICVQVAWSWSGHCRRSTLQGRRQAPQAMGSSQQHMLCAEGPERSNGWWQAHQQVSGTTQGKANKRLVKGCLIKGPVGRPVHQVTTCLARRNKGRAATQLFETASGHSGAAGVLLPARAQAKQSQPNRARPTVRTTLRSLSGCAAATWAAPPGTPCCCPNLPADPAHLSYYEDGGCSMPPPTPRLNNPCAKPNKLCGGYTSRCIEYDRQQRVKEARWGAAATSRSTPAPTRNTPLNKVQLLSCCWHRQVLQEQRCHGRHRHTARM